MNAPVLGPLLGAGKEADVFAFSSGALKLYRAAAAKRSAFREAANAAVAESLGLPVPETHAVRSFGNRWGILMSLAEGPTFAETIKAKPDQTSDYLKEMAILQIRVHSQPGAHFANLKARLADGSDRQRQNPGQLGSPSADIAQVRVCEKPAAMVRGHSSA